ncbi:MULTISPECIES: LPS assembly lipoprotein LptE [Sulfurimonas]|uniref:LPS assembly lipoprotein LptE n=1 Tax=Sulfurimonas TaxID=202746 RepID=UPI00165FFAA4|nr:LPS assembly lipoprotein LptE [Sulfurimonas hydrogeniphila]
MRKYSHALKVFVLLILLVSMNACGYKPSSKYARSVIGSKIYTHVVISALDPQNTVLIKDAVDSAIVEIFHASLTDKSHADTTLNFSLTPPSYSPIQYNAEGYIIAYRAKIVLKIARESKNIKKTYTARGTYDFSVVPNAVITDQERFDAIKFSAIKAIASFVAQVSAEGSQL